MRFRISEFGFRINCGLLIAGLLAIAIPLQGAGTDVADAAKARDAVAVKALLKQGADVNGAQGDGMTALHWAAMNGDAALTQMLLSGRRKHSRHHATRRHHRDAHGQPGRSRAGRGRR
jgi:hypothetical protein